MCLINIKQIAMRQNTEKKKVIITFCKKFPASHSRAGELTGFEPKIKNGKKIHTIRADKKGTWKKNVRDINSGKKYLSMREWTGRPYNSEQREYGQRERIGLQSITMTYNSEDALPQAWVDGKKVPVETLAKTDGLSTQDFVEWFFGTKLYSENVFEGKIIHITDFRY